MRDMQVDHSKKTFLEALQLLSKELDASKKIEMSRILDYLPRRGYAAIFILCSLPFCIPFQIPGVSTPFGLLMAFLGFRMIFFRTPWWPKSLLQKKFSSALVKVAVLKTIKVVEMLQKLIFPRLRLLTQNSILIRLHGLLIMIMSLVLSLPIPIPTTNLLSAMPIFFIGLGLLEDDGVAIILGYIAAAICVAAFVVLILISMHLPKLLAFAN